MNVWTSYRIAYAQFIVITLVVCSTSVTASFIIICVCVCVCACVCMCSTLVTSLFAPCFRSQIVSGFSPHCYICEVFPWHIVWAHKCLNLVPCILQHVCLKVKICFGPGSLPSFTVYYNGSVHHCAIALLFLYVQCTIV